MAKFKFYVGTGYVGSTREEEVEIPDEEFDGCESQQDKDDIISDWFNDWLGNHLESGWYELK